MSMSAAAVHHTRQPGGSRPDPRRFGKCIEGLMRLHQCFQELCDGFAFGIGIHPRSLLRDIFLFSVIALCLAIFSFALMLPQSKLSSIATV